MSVRTAPIANYSQRSIFLPNSRFFRCVFLSLHAFPTRFREFPPIESIMLHNAVKPKQINESRKSEVMLYTTSGKRSFEMVNESNFTFSKIFAIFKNFFVHLFKKVSNCLPYLYSTILKIIYSTKLSTLIRNEIFQRNFSLSIVNLHRIHLHGDAS